MSLSNDPAPWRQWDATTREREYSPSACIGGNYQPYLETYAERSAAARRSAAPRLDLRYGPGAAQQLDLFVPPPTATPPPLLVFIHGGYWQELSKTESSFAALDAVRQGVAFAALDYTLAPTATVAQMVDECCTALAWLHDHAAVLGFDGSRVSVAGSSAGAHLAAMAALGRVPALRAAILVSGIYELEPLVGTSINDALALDVEAAQAMSPARRQLAGFPPSIVCWGAIETSEFKRQGQEFAARLQAAGTACDVFEVPLRNHFDVILDLANPATALGAATRRLL